MVISKRYGEWSQIKGWTLYRILLLPALEEADVLQISYQEQLFPDLIKLIEAAMITGGGSLCSLEY